MRSFWWPWAVAASGLQLERSVVDRRPCATEFNVEDARSAESSIAKAGICMQSLSQEEQRTELNSVFSALQTAAREVQSIPVVGRAQRAVVKLDKFNIRAVLAERMPSRIANLSVTQLWADASAVYQNLAHRATEDPNWEPHCGLACYVSAMSDLFYLWTLTKGTNCDTLHSFYWWPLGVQALKELECGPEAEPNDGTPFCKSDAEAYVQLATMATTVGYGYAVAPSSRMWHILHATAGAASLGSIADAFCKHWFHYMAHTLLKEPETKANHNKQEAAMKRGMLSALAVETVLTTMVWQTSFKQEYDDLGTFRGYTNRLADALIAAIGTIPTVGLGDVNPLRIDDHGGWPTPGLIQALVHTNNLLKAPYSTYEEDEEKRIPLKSPLADTEFRSCHAFKNLPWSTLNTQQENVMIENDIPDRVARKAAQEKQAQEWADAIGNSDDKSSGSRVPGTVRDVYQHQGSLSDDEKEAQVMSMLR